MLKKKRKLAIRFKSGNVFIHDETLSFFLSVSLSRDERLRDDNGCTDKKMKGWEERTNREAASRYLITRALCKIRRVSKINIRLELMFVRLVVANAKNSSTNFADILPRE